METLRVAFWVLLCFFMVPFCVVAWVVLFWVNPDDHEASEDDGFNWEEDTTEEYIRYENRTAA